MTWISRDGQPARPRGGADRIKQTSCCRVLPSFRPGLFPEIRVHYSSRSRLFFVCVIGTAATVFGEPGEFVGNNDESWGWVGVYGSQSKACCKQSWVAYPTRPRGRVHVGGRLSWYCSQCRA